MNQRDQASVPKGYDGIESFGKAQNQPLRELELVARQGWISYDWQSWR